MADLRIDKLQARLTLQAREGMVSCAAFFVGFVPLF